MLTPNTVKDSISQSVDEFVNSDFICKLAVTAAYTKAVVQWIAWASNSACSCDMHFFVSILIGIYGYVGCSKNQINILIALTMDRRQWFGMECYRSIRIIYFIQGKHAE